MAKEYKDLVVGLDIGTSKVMVVVAEVLPNSSWQALALHPAPVSNAVWWSILTRQCKAYKWH